MPRVRPTVTDGALKFGQRSDPSQRANSLYGHDAGRQADASAVQGGYRALGLSVPQRRPLSVAAYVTRHGYNFIS